MIDADGKGDAARSDNVKKKINSNMEKKWDSERNAEWMLGSERRTAAGYGMDEFSEAAAKD